MLTVTVSGVILGTKEEKFSFRCQEAFKICLPDHEGIDITPSPPRLL